MSNFFRVFVPIILLVVAVICIIIKTVKLRADKEKYKGDYATEGMFMGDVFRSFNWSYLRPPKRIILWIIHRYTNRTVYRYVDS